jgi:hypothetical protein
MANNGNGHTEHVHIVIFIPEYEAQMTLASMPGKAKVPAMPEFVADQVSAAICCA